MSGVTPTVRPATVLMESITRMRQYYADPSQLRIVGNRQSIATLAEDLGFPSASDGVPMLLLFAGIPVQIDDTAPPRSLLVVDRRWIS